MSSRVYTQVAHARFALTLAAKHNEFAVRWLKRGDHQMVAHNAKHAARYITVATEWAQTPEIMRQALSSTPLDLIAGACDADTYEASALKHVLAESYPETAAKLRAAHPNLLI